MKLQLASPDIIVWCSYHNVVADLVAEPTYPRRYNDGLKTASAWIN